MAMALPIIQAASPVSGATVQIKNSDQNLYVVLTPATPIASVTLAFPTMPRNGERLQIVSSQPIAAITLTNGTFSSNPTSLKARAPITFIYESAGVWWLVEDQGALADGTPRAWVNGAQKTAVKEVYRSAVVAGGLAVFDLTDASGNAIFTNVYKESSNFWIDDPINQYQFGGYTLSGDKKTLTVNVNRIGLSLGILIFTASSNGTTVYLSVKGD